MPGTRDGVAEALELTEATEPLLRAPNRGCDLVQALDDAVAEVLRACRAPSGRAERSGEGARDAFARPRIRHPEVAPDPAPR